MKLRQTLVLSIALSFPLMALAQYGSPESLKAEMNQGDDLVFAKSAVALQPSSNLANAIFTPLNQVGTKSPALVLLPTCGGISLHIYQWAEEALKRGYVVLIVDSLRGLKMDCGSPSKVSNGRYIKDALDGMAHLATLPNVDSQRISVIGLSKGAMISMWLASSSVAKAIRPDAPVVASTASLYAFCGLAPTRGRPSGATILQPDTDRPFLLLMGGKDIETPPGSCLERLPKLKEAGAPVQWHLYPEATHAWDESEKNGFTKIDFKGDRITYIYDKAVTEDSRKRVFEFLVK